MNIVILDGHTLNPGDNSWDPIRKLGEVTVFDRTPAHLIIERAKDAEVILTNKTPITRETLDCLPRVRFISVLATGYNVVDTDACAERGVIVSNVPEYGTRAVAQYVFALILELTHRVGQHADAVTRGKWAESGDFSFWETPQIELAGLTLGIVGSGRIGSQVAAIGQAFGMHVVAVTRSRPPAPGIESASIEEVLKRADVLSLHCPSTPETRGLVSAASLRAMKPTAFLINTARGDLVDEGALTAALDQGVIAGAALDVVIREPIASDHPLLRNPRCIVTPHMAWSALGARQRLMQTTAENISAYRRGSPQNVAGGR